MEFEQLVTSIKALAPSSVKMTYKHVVGQSMHFQYSDFDGDKLSIEIELCRMAGTEITVATVTEKGICWYFSPELCQWLGMVSTLIVDYKGQ